MHFNCVAAIIKYYHHTHITNLLEIIRQTDRQQKPCYVLYSQIGHPVLFIMQYFPESCLLYYHPQSFQKTSFGEKCIILFLMVMGGCGMQDLHLNACMCCIFLIYFDQIKEDFSVYGWFQLMIICIPRASFIIIVFVCDNRHNLEQPYNC